MKRHVIIDERDVEVSVKFLSEHATLPAQKTSGSAGYDLYAIWPGTVAPGQTCIHSLGLAIRIPDGHVGLIKDRSSLAAQGLHVLGGVIDSDYRGEVRVVLHNLSQTTIRFDKGDRIAQLVVVPVVTTLPVIDPFLPGETERGNGGFGSTGK